MRTLVDPSSARSADEDKSLSLRHLIQGKEAFLVDFLLEQSYDKGKGKKGLQIMFKRKWDWLLIPHVLIVLWAILFNLFCFVYEEGEIAELLAPGIIAGLFVSIPLAIVSLIARSKKRFSDKCSVPILALSIANLLVGIQSWLFLVAIMRMP